MFPFFRKHWGSHNAQNCNAPLQWRIPCPTACLRPVSLSEGDCTNTPKFCQHLLPHPRGSAFTSCCTLWWCTKRLWALSNYLQEDWIKPINPWVLLKEFCNKRKNNAVKGHLLNISQLTAVTEKLLTSDVGSCGIKFLFHIMCCGAWRIARTSAAWQRCGM